MDVVLALLHSQFCWAGRYGKRNGKDDKYHDREFQGNLEVYNRGLTQTGDLGKASWPQTQM